jgi:hypothetical protein
MFLENFFAEDFDGICWHSTARGFDGSVGFTRILRSQTKVRSNE